MDKFEQKVMSFSKLSSKEQMQILKDDTGSCICPDCPTYNDCAKDSTEGLFCAHGSSFHCISLEKDCFCPSCPITEQYGLTRNFFCIRGSEAAQRWVGSVLIQK
jgi:hypothetical protein